MPSSTSRKNTRTTDNIRKGHSHHESASRKGFVRYAAVYPPNIAKKEKAETEAELFAYQMSLADGRHVALATRLTLWKDCHTTGTYIVYEGYPADKRDILMPDAEPIKRDELADLAKHLSYFTDDASKKPAREAEWEAMIKRKPKLRAGNVLKKILDFIERYLA